MGLDFPTAEFLLWCRQRGVNFGTCATLGRQEVKLNERQLAWIESAHGVRLQAGGQADDFFRKLGADELNAIDASAYEGANIIHNLNAPLPPELTRRFSVLIDGGTLEHVFDFPLAYKSCLQMVQVGGHFLACTIANNLMGHGFYQFSPELFWETLNEENGFAVEGMYLHEAGTWYEALNCADNAQRQQALTSRETFLFVVARRVAERPLFEKPPHQRYYLPSLDEAGAQAEAKLGLKTQLLNRLAPLRRAQFWWRELKYRRACRLSNPRIFRRVGARL